MKFKVLLWHAPALFTVRGMRRGVEPRVTTVPNKGGMTHKILIFYGLFNSREKARAFW